MEQYPHIDAILRARADGTATPEQEQAFWDWLHGKSDPQPLKDHVFTLLDAYPEDARVEGVEWERIYQVIEHKAMPAIRPMRRLIRWTAAAAILLLAISGYFLWKPDGHSTIATQRPTTDVAPGRSAAVLTLAGGQQVTLDSAMHGVIGRQGKSTVITRNGQLVYEGAAANVYNTLTTRRGNQYQLVLPDGSKVWLNASSSITYPLHFTGTHRTVIITGEAYFEVVHNDKAPFQVRFGNHVLEDLGTRFNINAYSDELVSKTTLLEGAVAIDQQRLRPGEQARTRDAQTTVTTDVDLEEVMAWKDGYFRYTGAQLEDILRQAARWYDVHIEYQGHVTETFSGGISRNVNISQLLHILEMTRKVHFEIHGNTIIVQPTPVTR